jgi:acetyltransferase-like isoleucine patch superfamily enzyme
MEKIVIGESTYINRTTMIDACHRLEIGAHCMIGPFCYITDHDHAFGTAHDPGAGPLISEPTYIGDRCWLGAHVSVLKGVTIGEGSVIGAGSVVTKSLPAGVVAVGNPARVVRIMKNDE